MTNEDDHTLLARIDERTRHVESAIAALTLEIDEYVTRVEFQPVKLIVFGLVGLILSGVFAAIITLVLSTRHG